MLNNDQILNALRHVDDPDLKKDIVSLGMVRDLKTTDNSISFSVYLTTPACPMKDHIEQACRNAIKHFIPGEFEVNILMTAEVKDTRSDKSVMSGIRNIIAVASGKGGVGKSTVAAGLAAALSQAGAKVGIMDADIYGPSIPILFGVQDEPIEMIPVNGRELMKPVEASGIKLFSIGFLSRPDEAIVWRGPMVSQAIRQFMNDVYWGELDYLIVDLPPGTGDVQLTLVQNLPLSGAVIVCTPQKLAVADATRACSMFAMPAVNIPILGVVENMATFSPPGKPDEVYHLFGEGATIKLAERFETVILGSLPVDTRYNSSEENKPLFHSENTGIFTNIAGKLVQQLAIRLNQQSVK